MGDDSFGKRLHDAHDHTSRVLTTAAASGEIRQCQHKSVTPKWDAEAAKGMDTYEIRKHFPRFMGTCPDCRQMVIVYASYEQYIAGDY